MKKTLNFFMHGLDGGYERYFLVPAYRSWIFWMNFLMFAAGFAYMVSVTVKVWYVVPPGELHRGMVIFLALALALGVNQFIVHHRVRAALLKKKDLGRTIVAELAAWYGAVYLIAFLFLAHACDYLLLYARK